MVQIGDPIRRITSEPEPIEAPEPVPAPREPVPA